MKPHELKTLLPMLLSDTDSATKIAKIAKNSKQSLNGNSQYAHKFHDSVRKITTVEKMVRPFLPELKRSEYDQQQFDALLIILKDTNIDSSKRVKTQRDFHLLCESTLLHKVDSLTVSSVPQTEQVLPIDVVKDDWFLKKLFVQINGCYERQWYDACSVMIRKVIEHLVICLFEHKGVAAEIKDGENYFMLKQLITTLEQKTTWTLGRETKPLLKDMKSVGDRGAHTRDYITTKPDIDKLINNGLRVAVEELMSKSGKKKTT